MLTSRLRFELHCLDTFHFILLQPKARSKTVGAQESDSEVVAMFFCSALILLMHVYGFEGGMLEVDMGFVLYKTPFYYSLIRH